MLLDEIITKLSDESQSITGILLKTKVLLADIDQPDLVEWVNRELNGYSAGDTLPGYRIVSSEVRANLVAMTFRAENHSIPLGHLTEQQLQKLERSEIRDGLSVAEALGTSEGTLQRSLPMEMNGFLGKGLAQGVRINSAWLVINPVQVADISAQVRSRLLDFMLKLRSTVGRSAPDEEIKERSAGFDAASAFQNTVFSGPTNIIVGNHAVQHIESTVIAGDWASLKTALKKSGLPSEEITALHAAVHEDEKSLGKATFDGATGRWYAGLLGKVAKGTLKIGLNIATSDVATALGHYIGINS